MLNIDLHVHTIASGYALSTVNEIALHAKEKGMKVIGITDHGPSLNSINADFIYFNVLPRLLPKKLYGIRLLSGVEANIVDENGALDLKDEILKKLDVVMAALHLGNQYNNKNDHTKAVLNAMKNKYVKILTHPYFDIDFKIDIESIAKKACEKNILLEVNISEFSKDKFNEDKRYIENLKKMIRIVKENKKKVIVNSDAHSVWEIGDDLVLEKYKKEIGLTDDMIINNYPEELEEFLGVKF